MKLYVIFNQIDGHWQADGEWFLVRDNAIDQAESNKDTFHWPYRVVSVDMPIDAVPKQMARELVVERQLVRRRNRRKAS